MNLPFRKMFLVSGNVCSFFWINACLCYVKEVPELVCLRRSEVVYVSGILEAILKWLKIVAYLSTCPADTSKLVRYCAQEHAARKISQCIAHVSLWIHSEKGRARSAAR